ncbi:MAG TPA: ricin-type beta-trefoil lectin domain protein [Longimicrobium sp.]|nr:ricin-type beta-trefoil lectin domain protein [Longimicrobium sp.]
MITRRARTLRLCLGLLVAAAASVALPRTASAQTLFENLAYASKCMDNAGGNLSDGNPLVSYACQNSVNQYFQRLSDGHVVVQKGQIGPRGYQMCMDYYPTSGAIGDPVRIWPCHPISSPADTQHWYYLSSGQWLGASGNCVAATSSTNATQLRMAACNTSNPPLNTRWKVR